MEDIGNPDLREKALGIIQKLEIDIMNQSENDFSQSPTHKRKGFIANS
jgi:hypothetical protein